MNQIIAILKEHEAGMKLRGMVRRYSDYEQSICRPSRPPTGNTHQAREPIEIRH